MKYSKPLSAFLFSFLVSAILSAAAVVAVKYYIPFSNETAGSYAVATIFGDSIKIFLIKILSVVACLLAFVTFLLKSRKRARQKVLFPGFTVAFGVLWMILPLLSAYTISRFTGSLIIQTVTGIVIIANAVFMMMSVCFAGIAAIDLIHCIFMISGREKRANCAAMFLCGTPCGIAVAVFLSSVLQSSLGLSYVFVLLGAAALVVGILSFVFNGFKNKDFG